MSLGGPGAEVISLGCRLNLAESERIRALLGGARDVVVINSCAVTAEAVRQTRQAIRRMRRARRRVVSAEVVVHDVEAAQVGPGDGSSPDRGPGRLRRWRPFRATRP